jgi:hypothetical protein
MQKMYSRPSPSGQVDKNMVPKDKTVRFLLNYSKALRVFEYQSIKFETLLN